MVVAGSEKLKGFCGALGGLEETLTVDILAGGLKQVCVCCLDVAQSWQVYDTNVACRSIQTSWNVQFAVQVKPIVCWNQLLLFDCLRK